MDCNDMAGHRAWPGGLNMIRKCLFPAAGYGTRFLPATKSMPKEILPILDKPLIQYGVEEAVDAGIHEIAVVTGRGKRALEDHFDTNYELEHQISGSNKEHQLTDIRRLIDNCIFSYTRQIEMRGLGHAVLTGETLIGHEPFAVVLADDLCVGEDNGVLAQMLKVYEKYRCSVIAIQEVERNEIHKYGIIEGKKLEEDIFMISSMVEKPHPDEAPSNFGIVGRYILTPDIFDILRRTPAGKGGELQLTDALQIQAKENMVVAFKYRGQRFDCGSIDGFVDATNYFHNKRKQQPINITAAIQG
jgi:UTP--glucose-1-phosphate uridylyltransferase